MLRILFCTALLQLNPFYNYYRICVDLDRELIKNLTMREKTKKLFEK